ncbi:TetR/AcrR family transcriptional regulator [Nonomuraea typhae]|uniref:TetR/AcrR family transcriptional regulator n=1 Tax=Nonomuraea typhae TaxID=2603600 RepID=UPI0012FCE82E|nr:TetR family transcriptional regulator [Nonomuraea typhae]
MSATTRAKLLDAALETLRAQGIAGVSARTIAARAGVNQALVFYHFGSVDQLLAEACEHGSTERVAHYRARFAAVGDLRELVGLARAIHDEEQESGNITVLAQLLAGAQNDPQLAPATAAGLNLWIAELEQTLARVLSQGPLADLVDVPGLARAVAAAFVGLELYEGVDAEGAARALDSLDQLAVLVGVLDEMSPLVRRAVAGRLRKATTARENP